MPLSRKIREGYSNEIYALGEDQILKLGQDESNRAELEREATVCNALRAAGIPVPSAEAMEIQGRPALVFDRMNGQPLLQNLKTRPWTVKSSAQLFAELHVSIHLRTFPGLPSQRERLVNNIQAVRCLSPSKKEKILKILGEMPDGSSLCHGDFHPGNVLMTTSGPLIIDWADAASGNPLADVAKTSLLLYVRVPFLQPVGWLVDAARRWFRGLYLNRYFHLRAEDERQLSSWELIVGAAGLGELSRKVPQNHWVEGRLLALVLSRLPLHD